MAPETPAWLAWGPEPFARAKETGRPVLLNMAPHRRDVFESPEVSALVAQRFVPVALDCDERPDVVVRYGGRKGHVTVLSAAGERLDQTLAGHEGLSDDLERYADSYHPDETGTLVVDENRPVWTGAVSERPAPQPLPPGWPREVVERLKEFRFGNPVLNGRFDILDTLLYAAGEWADAAARDLLVRELVEVGAPLFDVKDGGLSLFYDLKRLGPNAQACRLCWEAWALTGAPALRERAQALAAFLVDRLYDPSTGAFRNTLEGPPLFYADANAMAVLALLRAAGVSGEDRWLGPALSALSYLTSRLYDPLLGFLHRRPGEGEATVYGLLGDNAWACLALTEAFLATGDKARRELADEVLRHMFQELWEREGGGFSDRVPRPDDQGLLKRPWLVPELNAAALEAAWRLHHLKGSANYKRWLEWGLRGLRPHFDSGSGAHPEAPFARLCDMLGRGRTDLELVGRLEDPRTRALLAAVHRHYLPRKVVSFVDPDDQDYLLAHKLDAAGPPRLFGCMDLREKAHADLPGEVPGLLGKLALAAGP